LNGDAVGVFAETHHGKQDDLLQRTQTSFTLLDFFGIIK